MDDRSRGWGSTPAGAISAGQLTRRAALGLGVGAVVAGCAGVPPAARRAGGQGTPATAATTTPSATTATGPATSTAPTGPARSATGQRGAATLAELEARYDGLAPRTWGLQVPGVVRSIPADGAKVVALTFDACGGRGGSGYDAALVDLLRRNQVKATLFLNYRWMKANPSAVRDLADDPLFELANHGTRHQPLSVRGRAAYGIPGTQDVREVYEEVETNAAFMERMLGRPVPLFRCGTAFYDDVAARIVHDLGRYAVGFSVNGDAGATFTAPQIVTALRDVRPGSIVIAHLNHPERATTAGLRQGIPALRREGYEFVQLSDRLV
jgi:peptidoglycan/xylan/chitin deacetylase (PgdA/CDA1 family)